MRKRQEEAEFLEVLRALKGITKNVFYIPGNHDPAEAFPDKFPAVALKASTIRPKQSTQSDDLIPGPLWQRMQQLTGAINFHRRVVRLAPNLLMSGLGGSPPQTLYDQPDKVAHKGYPYTDQELTRMLDTLLRPKKGRPLMLLPNLPDIITVNKRSNLIQSNNEPDWQILVTHCGPAGLGTTDVNRTPHIPDTRLETGSRGFRKVLSSPEYQSPLATENSSVTPAENIDRPVNVLFNIHGHSHFSHGVSHLGRIPIINPGPLKDGRYAIATIEHVLGMSMQMEWKLVGVEFWKL
ncbi:Metallo-dependent phosphatase-like protein [Gaertneriomyces semiglobifer]|nr:Metallo-dependent phosphatase-like protein [Gaertneriomyces semiglobifer]